MKNLLIVAREKILNLLFPQKSSVVFLEKLAAENRLRELPESGSDVTGNVTALFSYQDPRARELVWQIKYKRNPILTSAVGKLLFEEILEYQSDKHYFRNRECLLIPIPISPGRRRERGFNQTEALAKAIEKEDAENIFMYAPDILKKSVHTESQTKTRSKGERLENLKGSFAVADASQVASKDIILLDDVITTGATFAEARRALKGAGARNIFCLAIAH